MSARRSALVLLAAALPVSGCYTTTNVVRVDPLDTEYPVSATAQYVDRQGAIVDDAHYTVKRPFEFQKNLSGPRHMTTESKLLLKPELDSLMAEAQGEAITNLKIQAVDYDPGSHGSAAGWKVFGWSFGLTGGTFAIMGAAIGGDGGGILIGTGLAFAALGVVGFVAGGAADDPSVWKLKVTGEIVQSGGGAPAPASAAPAL